MSGPLLEIFRPKINIIMPRLIFRHYRHKRTVLALENVRLRSYLNYKCSVLKVFFSLGGPIIMLLTPQFFCKALRSFWYLSHTHPFCQSCV